MNKSKAERIHTERRLLERYGIKYTQRLYDYIRLCLRTNKSICIQKSSNRITIHEVIIYPNEKEVINSNRIGNPLTIKIVYDKYRKQIVTVLK
jgi:hypothetical protein